MRRMNVEDVAKRVLEFLTDIGTNFQATLMQELYNMLDVHGLRTSPYHPDYQNDLYKRLKIDQIIYKRRKQSTRLG